jgi:hypothetical protein
MADKPSSNIPEKKLSARTTPPPDLSGLGGVKVRVTAILGSMEITFDRAV